MTVKPEPGAVIRLQRELVMLQKDPVPFVRALPDGDNILEWHYVLEGPEGTPYTGGFYHGLIRFPANYPWSPPAFFMYTPSGRFDPGVRLCLTMSDYHPETWSQAWRISTLLNGLLSFMVASDYSHIGAIQTTDAERKVLAAKSLDFNKKNPKFCLLFPELCSGAPKLTTTASLAPPPSVTDDEKVARQLQEQMDAEARAAEEADAELARQLSESMT
jgi:ubiquitin-conjugating enzyme E2 J2